MYFDDSTNGVGEANVRKLTGVRLGKGKERVEVQPFSDLDSLTEALLDEPGVDVAGIVINGAAPNWYSALLDAKEVMGLGRVVYLQRPKDSRQGGLHNVRTDGKGYINDNQAREVVRDLSN